MKGFLLVEFFLEYMWWEKCIINVNQGRETSYMEDEKVTLPVIPPLRPSVSLSTNSYSGKPPSEPFAFSSTAMNEHHLLAT